MPRDDLHVAVVGPGDASSDEEVTAEEVGRLVAEAAATVVCGGLGGVMAAACRGAHRAGGTSVGILPGADRNAANEWVTIAIPTGLGEARNTLVVRTADVVIAVGGGHGTLSEIAFALKTGVPVVGVGTWHLVRNVGVEEDGIRRADSAAEAVRTALGLAGSVRPEDGEDRG